MYRVLPQSHTQFDTTFFHAFVWTPATLFLSLAIKSQISHIIKCKMAARKTQPQGKRLAKIKLQLIIISARFPYSCFSLLRLKLLWSLRFFFFFVLWPPFGLLHFYFGIDWGHLPMQLFELGGNTFLFFLFFSMAVAWLEAFWACHGACDFVAIMTAGRNMTSFGCLAIFLGGWNENYREIAAKR